MGSRAEERTKEYFVQAQQTRLSDILLSVCPADEELQHSMTPRTKHAESAKNHSEITITNDRARSPLARDESSRKMQRTCATQAS